MTGNGPMPARPTVSEPRRDEIMAAAKKVFAHNGFDGTTIADVAKQADLPFDVVYQYFDSKDALFEALIGQLAHRRLITDDGVTAADVADFVVEFIGNGLRPRKSSKVEP